MSTSDAGMRWRVLKRIAAAGTDGLRRSAIRETAGSRYRTEFFAELQRAVDDGVVEFVPRPRSSGRFRLAPAAVLAIAVINPGAVIGDLVAEFWSEPEPDPEPEPEPEPEPALAGSFWA